MCTCKFSMQIVQHGSLSCLQGSPAEFTEWDVPIHPTSLGSFRSLCEERRQYCKHLVSAFCICKYTFYIDQSLCLTFLCLRRHFPLCSQSYFKACHVIAGEIRCAKTNTISLLQLLRSCRLAFRTYSSMRG